MLFLTWPSTILAAFVKWKKYVNNHLCGKYVSHLFIVGFKTTPTVVWCADHTALCGPHPHSRLRNYPTTTISPQYILTFFIKFLEKKIFLKEFKNFFFQNLEKMLTNELWGWCAGADNTTLKKAVVVRSAEPH